MYFLVRFYCILTVIIRVINIQAIYLANSNICNILYVNMITENSEILLMAENVNFVIFTGLCGQFL